MPSLQWAAKKMAQMGALTAQNIQLISSMAVQ